MEASIPKKNIVISISCKKDNINIVKQILVKPGYDSI